MAILLQYIDGHATQSCVGEPEEEDACFLCGLQLFGIEAKCEGDTF